ncbi:hypothetical protein E2C01_040744 [Portunus trituberculatus]|uniref:Uncharacterized protein n=1 Tax=Portunus trituberculatus TaxID=210409 RepID=A0A5B7FHG2_PORTR|nr:hypothetical protein [Portunus trituberculatus]
MGEGPWALGGGHASSSANIYKTNGARLSLRGIRKPHPLLLRPRKARPADTGQQGRGKDTTPTITTSTTTTTCSSSSSFSPS